MKATRIGGSAATLAIGALLLVMIAAAPAASADTEFTQVSRREAVAMGSCGDTCWWEISLYVQSSASTATDPVPQQTAVLWLVVSDWQTNFLCYDSVPLTASQYHVTAAQAYAIGSTACGDAEMTLHRTEAFHSGHSGGWYSYPGDVNRCGNVPESESVVMHYAENAHVADPAAGEAWVNGEPQTIQWAYISQDRSAAIRCD